MSNYPDNDGPTRAYFRALDDAERARQEIGEDDEAAYYAAKIAAILAEARRLFAEAQINGDIGTPPQKGPDRAARKAAEINHAIGVVRETLDDLLTPDACRRIRAFEEAFPDA